MNNIQKNPWLISMPRVTLCIFIVLNILSMFCYSGSTYHDHLTLGYSFTHNFLSDLGRTMNFAGEINFLSSQF